MGGMRATYRTETKLVMVLKVSATDMITNTNTQSSYIWPRTDFVMVFHTLKAQLGVIKAAVTAVKSGEISQLAIKSSVKQLHRVNANYSSPCASVEIKVNMRT